MSVPRSTMCRMDKWREIRQTLHEFALGLPEAFEDHPWGETVVKVNKKIFLFLGADDSETPGLSVKLPVSRDLAMGVPGAQPTGYGLGKAGWVSLQLDASSPPIG